MRQRRRLTRDARLFLAGDVAMPQAQNSSPTPQSLQLGRPDTFSCSSVQRRGGQPTAQTKEKVTSSVAPAMKALRSLAVLRSREFRDLPDSDGPAFVSQGETTPH